MNGFETWWGEPENKVIDAMKIIKDYCEKQDICNACPMFHIYQEAYQTGFEEAKEKIIHSIAKQYSEHNKLVPIWLSIGDIKGGVE